MEFFQSFALAGLMFRNWVRGQDDFGSSEHWTEGTEVDATGYFLGGMVIKEQAQACNTVKTGWLVGWGQSCGDRSGRNGRRSGVTVITEQTPQGQKARFQHMCCALAVEIVCLLFQRETGQSRTG